MTTLAEALRTATFSHVDAPAHAVGALADRTIDHHPVDRFIAPYAKYDLSRHAPRPGDLVSRATLQEVGDRDGFEPQSERLWWIRNAPGLAEDACTYLAGRGVIGVGSDTATCDAAVVDGTIISAVGHNQVFLPNEILLFEGLIGLGAAPIRAVLIG